MTPPRIRGLVDKLERAVRMEIYAKPADKRTRKNEVLQAKMELLKAFAIFAQRPVNPAE
jgi:hypothetical protein